MKKILISRKDHEVYFISLPKNMDKKQKHSYIMEQLHTLHPGFSSSTLIDIGEITIDSKVWIMATVIEQDVLTEYRILHRGAAFFTRTSLLVHEPDFTQKPIHDFTSERIGFDPHTKQPLSLPLTESETNQNTPEDEEMLSALLKKASARNGVFTKRRSPLLILIPVILVICILFFVLFLKNIDARTSDNVVPQIEQTQPLPIIPSPVNMLADISALILEHGGIIQQWQYNEIAMPPIIVHIEGADAGFTSDSIKKLDYLLISSVSDIQYNQQSPQYSILLSLRSEAYRTPVCTAFDGIDTVFPVLNLIKEMCADTNTTILSELLSSQSQYNSITITFNSPAESFLQTLEQLEHILAEKALWIQQMNVSMNPAKDSFLWSCSLIPRQPEEDAFLGEYDKQDILDSFGYKPVQIKSAPQRPPVPVEITAVQNDNNKKIGTIYESDNSKTIFYRNEEGKIIIQEE